MLTKLISDAVDKAIKRYEKYLVEKNRTISERRAYDVTALRVIIAEEYDIDELLELIESTIDAIRTGVWIFQTGRSRLKNEVLYAIQPFKNSLLLESYASALNFQSHVQDGSLLGVQSDFELELVHLRRENDLLRKEVKRMQIKITALMEGASSSARSRLSLCVNGFSDDRIIFDEDDLVLVADDSERLTDGANSHSLGYGM